MVVFDLLGEEVDLARAVLLGHASTHPTRTTRGRRHISVVTSLNDRGVLGLATRLRDSAFKRSPPEPAVGADVEVEQPKGNFLLPEDASQPYVFIAGGIGITVFRSTLRYIAEEGLPHRVTLVFSNRNRESTAFLDEPPGASRARFRTCLVLTMTDDPNWEGETRRIDAEMLRGHLDGELDAFTYLIAGPPPMVEAISGVLSPGRRARGSGAPERFSGYWSPSMRASTTE